MALLGIELHLPNSSPGEKLVDGILQDETVSWVGYCPVQNAIISKQSDLRLDFTGDVMYRKKRRGPRTVPCGPSDVIGSQED